MTQQNNEFEKWFDKQLDNGTAFTSEEQITRWAWQAAKADSEHQTGEMIRAISLAADAREAALEREIAELKSSNELLHDALDSNQISEKELLSYREHINVLHEALEKIVGHDMACSVIAKQALASTSEQSLIKRSKS